MKELKRGQIYRDRFKIKTKLILQFDQKYIEKKMCKIFPESRIEILDSLQIEFLLSLKTETHLCKIRYHFCFNFHSLLHFPHKTPSVLNNFRKLYSLH